MQTYYNRGESYYALGEYQKAISDFSKVIAHDLNDKEAYLNRDIIAFVKSSTDF